MYRVHIGWTSTGRDRWRYFDTMEEARAACAAVFERTRVVLTIERAEA